MQTDFLSGALPNLLIEYLLNPDSIVAHSVADPETGLSQVRCISETAAAICHDEC
jgi:hypothetical protein